MLLAPPPWTFPGSGADQALTFAPMDRIITIILLLAVTQLPAQTFRASVLAGANFSQIDGDMLFGFHKLGANAGLRVVAVVDDNWRVGPEILFSQQGAKRNVNASLFDEFELTTLEVPLMAYYKDWRLTGEAGFSYQRLINFKVIDAAGQDITEASPLNDNLFAIKVGVTFFLTPKWGINFRWSKHLADIDVKNSVARTLKGRTISLRAVYTFGDGESLPAKPQDRDFNN